MEEKKCLDQGTVLLHGGEDKAEEKYSILGSCKDSSGNRTFSMVTRSRHPLSRRVPSLVSPVVAGTFPFARKFVITSSLEL